MQDWIQPLIEKELAARHGLLAVDGSRIVLHHTQENNIQIREVRRIPGSEVGMPNF